LRGKPLILETCPRFYQRSLSESLYWGWFWLAIFKVEVMY